MDSPMNSPGSAPSDRGAARLSPGAPGDPGEFGPYLLYGLIARGGMAEVYRARRADGSGGMLAIKVMRPQLAREARFVDMFIREGRLAVLLDCDAIVRTWEVGEVEGRYFIAMEYIGGKDLTQVLRRCQETGQRLPVPHAIAIAASICEGLDFAHRRADAEGRPLNIVNRDVSPSNVRLAYDGRVKLLDFGIAQAMLKFTSEIGVLKGKFSYMSPEQIRGLPVDARTDVFSTGIILHEMLTTEKLFRGDTEFALMEKVRQADVLPPSKFNRRVGAELDRICLRALARDLEARYQSAAELRADLMSLLASYKFRDGELEEFMRGLFPQDVLRDEEELKECALGVRPPDPREIDANEISDGAMVVIEPSSPSGEVQAALSAPVPSAAALASTLEMRVPVYEGEGAGPPVDGRSGAGPADRGDGRGDGGGGGGGGGGLWSRIKQRLSR
jgi:serine/threonine protein kinase